MVVDPFQKPSDPGSRRIAQALLIQRVIFFALVFGVVIFGILVGTVVLPQQHGKPPNNTPPRILITINLLMFLLELPVMFFVRMIVFKRGRVGDRISFQAYGTGNIIFWAGCEGISFFGLVAAMLIGSMTPTIWIVLAAMGIMSLTFPMAGNLIDRDADNSESR